MSSGAIQRCGRRPSNNVMAMTMYNTVEADKIGQSDIPRIPDINRRCFRGRKHLTSFDSGDNQN